MRVSIDSVRVVEGNAGLASAVFTVRLSRLPSLLDGTIQYATQDLSAHADTDYIAVLGTLALSDTLLLYSIAVPVVGDLMVEGNERFQLRLSNPSAGFQLADSIGLGTIVNDERPVFEATRAGLTRYDIGNLAPAFGYANGDGWPDLPLDRNLGWGEFEQMPGMAAVLTLGNHHGSAWCDYDRDGRDDLVLTPYAESDTSSRVQLFHNLGDGVFEDVAPVLGMDVLGHAETPVWGDFDGDGWPDLFVPFYAHLPPGRSFLWRNNHDGTFTDIAEVAGVALENLPGEFRPEGAAAVDWNGDGSLDLYCAQHLFLNDGTAHFTDVRELVGLPRLFDEGAKFVDVDGDGDFDLYLRCAEGPKLYRNDSGQFVDITEQAALAPRVFYWGDSWADVDNDGDLDLMIMNSGNSFAIAYNQGDGTFVSESSFDVLEFESSVSAWADVDLDGDLDASLGGSMREILFNQLDEKPGARRAAFRVWALDADSMMTCPGAIARLREIDGGPGACQTRVVDGGSGYLSQCEYPLHFGGIGTGRYSLEVRYPGSPTTATVVDGSVVPLLADFNPIELGMGNLFVFRDGRVSWRQAGLSNVLAVPRPPAATPWATGTALGPPRPTPARDRVGFSARLDGSAAEITVHDLAGRRVRSLVRNLEAAGERAFAWDLRDDAGLPVPGGLYFLRLTTGGRVSGERKVVVLR